ncbi:MAG: FadR family transcriptional regulator [Eubacteriaceae bacterium]|nr:FadR family transcriptional regulator [Eubacteriaceae bacterium]
MAEKNKMKIEKISVVDQVVDEIKQTIISDKYKAGDKLPSETEMAQLYGVNRLSVRMAFQKLNTLGVIETKVGDGSYVRDFSMYPIINEIVDFYNGEDRLEEIQQMRRLLELECVALAMKLATDDEKDELKRCLDRYHKIRDLMLSSESESLFEQTIDADLEFHSQIVKMSHNRLYEEIYYMVQKLIRSHISTLMKKRRIWMRQLGNELRDGHDYIYEEICNGNISAAQKLIDEMLDIIPPQGQPEQ